MKEVPIRRFTTVVNYLTEPVNITNNGETIGFYTPLSHLSAIAKDVPVIESIKEASVQDPVKKAIEIEKPRVDKTGQIRKGLGPLPGEPTGEPTLDVDRTYREFRPVPKPGKK